MTDACSTRNDHGSSDEVRGAHGRGDDNGAGGLSQQAVAADDTEASEATACPTALPSFVTANCTGTNSLKTFLQTTTA